MAHEAISVQSSEMLSELKRYCIEESDGYVPGVKPNEGVSSEPFTATMRDLSSSFSGISSLAIADARRAMSAHMRIKSFDH